MTVKIDIEMPKGCDSCMLCAHIPMPEYEVVQEFCPAIETVVDGYYGERHPDCPLQEVKE